MEDQEKLLSDITNREYEYGFVTDIDTDVIPKGLSEDVVRLISAKKNEPEFMLEFRLNAYREWLKMKAPEWAYLKIPPIDFQETIYYAAPRTNPKYESMDQVDPELIDTFNKLGISIEEQKHLAGVAVDVVMDSVSVKTTFKNVLAEKGVIFCSFSEALTEHPELVKKYLGMAVPTTDNFFAALNSAVFRMVRFAISPKEFIVQWNFQRISG